MAVADPDEWDDLGAPSALGPYNATMTTLDVSLRRVLPGSVALTFDSSWRPEGNQRAELRASFDAGAPVTLLVWDSLAGGNFHADAPNEAVALAVETPPGASTMRLTFSLLNARNNWWWAVDNINVVGARACPADITADGGVDGDDVIQFFAAWDAGLADADFNSDGGVDGDDVIDFFARWDAGC